MFCANCGMKLPTEAKFCPSCGAKIRADAASAGQAANAAVKESQGQNPDVAGGSAFAAQPRQGASQKAEDVGRADSPSAVQNPHAGPLPREATPEAGNAKAAGPSLSGQAPKDEPPLRDRDAPAPNAEAPCGAPSRGMEKGVPLKILCGVLGALGAVGMLSALVDIFGTVGAFSQISYLASKAGSVGVGAASVAYVVFSLTSLALSAALVFVDCLVVLRWSPDRNDGFFVSIGALNAAGLALGVISAVTLSLMVGGAIGVGSVIGAAFSMLIGPGLYYLLAHLAGLTPLKAKGGFSAFMPELRKAPAMLIECAKSLKK